MTHYVVSVILPEGWVPTDNIAAGQLVAPLIASFDENMPVPEYDRSCYCIVRNGRSAAVAAADERFGPMELLRETFQTECPVELVDVETADEAFARFAVRQEAWMTFIAPRIEFEESVLAALVPEPHPDCPECGGSGTYRSTYNPKSKWDWWEVGGRWSGEINDRDFGPMREVPDEAFSTDVVTPDGEWHTSGTHGWWGTFNKELPDDEWNVKLAGFRTEYADHWVVNIDCHI